MEGVLRRSLFKNNASRIGDPAVGEELPSFPFESKLEGLVGRVIRTKLPVTALGLSRGIISEAESPSRSIFEEEPEDRVRFRFLTTALVTSP